MNGCVLSLYETEYQQISVAPDKITVIDLKGRKKLITFSTQMSLKSARELVRSADVNEASGHLPREGKDQTFVASASPETCQILPKALKKRMADIIEELKGQNEINQEIRYIQKDIRRITPEELKYSKYKKPKEKI